mmetsp:Transcript_30911/g.63105  ORF Transcript_30911/g.63105 Transcript_30911/m.63105 type:complete len:228 (+) Transcript_30911:247-930(+)
MLPHQQSTLRKLIIQSTNIHNIGTVHLHLDLLQLNRHYRHTFRTQSDHMSTSLIPHYPKLLHFQMIWQSDLHPSVLFPHQKKVFVIRPIYVRTILPHFRKVCQQKLSILRFRLRKGIYGIPLVVTDKIPMIVTIAPHGQCHGTGESSMIGKQRRMTKGTRSPKWRVFGVPSQKFRILAEIGTLVHFLQRGTLKGIPVLILRYGYIPNGTYFQESFLQVRQGREQCIH